MPDLSIETMWMCESNRGWVKQVKGSKGDTYVVRFERTHGGQFEFDFSCTCKAFKFGRGKQCKHIRAVEDEKCSWHQQFDGEDVTRDENGEARCPKCGEQAVAIRVGV